MWARGPEGIEGAPSEKADLEGPVGGTLISLLEESPVGGSRSSFKARGPVGGGLPVTLLASDIEAVRFGTDPKDGAAGAMGGGDTSLADAGGS